MRLGPFLGLVTTPDGDAKPIYARSMRNCAIGDGRIRKRPGYEIWSQAPATDTVILALAEVAGNGVRVTISVEQRGAVVNLYGVADDGTRTLIETALPAGPYRIVPYGDGAYLICPIAVFRYDAAANTLREVVGVDPAPDPDAPKATVTGTVRNLLATLTNVTPSAAFTGTVGGSYTLSASKESDGIKVLFDSNEDDVLNQNSANVTLEWDTGFEPSMTGVDAVAITIEGRDTPDDGFTGDKLTLDLQGAASGSLTAIEGFRDGATPESLNKATFWFDVSALPAAVRAKLKRLVIGLRMNMRRDAQLRITKIETSGTYYTNLRPASFADARPTEENALRYAIWYEESGNRSGTAQVVVPASDHLGSRLAGGYGPGLGSRVSITASPYIAPSFTSAATVKLARQAVDGRWRLVYSGPNTAALAYAENYRDSHLNALPEVDAGIDGSISQTPTFQPEGVTSAFSMLGWVCWLYRGGKGNVRHSRLGNPVFLADPDDTDEDDDRGATFSLEDGLQDDPVAGVAVGNTAVLFGSRGVYAQRGDRPSSLTPPRRIVGAPALLSPSALARMDLDGTPGAVYVDSELRGVWWVGSQPVFAGDGGAPPVELSRGQRGLLTEWLGSESGAVHLATDETDRSLWVIRGRRSLRLTDVSPIDGNRQWEAHQYNALDVTHEVLSWSAWSATSSGSATSLDPDSVAPIVWGVAVPSAPGVSSMIRVEASGTCEATPYAVGLRLRVQFLDSAGTVAHTALLPEWLGAERSWSLAVDLPRASGPYTARAHLVAATSADYAAVTAAVSLEAFATNGTPASFGPGATLPKRTDLVSGSEKFLIFGGTITAQLRGDVPWVALARRIDVCSDATGIYEAPHGPNLSRTSTVGVDTAFVTVSGVPGRRFLGADITPLGDHRSTFEAAGTAGIGPHAFAAASIDALATVAPPPDADGGATLKVRAAGIVSSTVPEGGFGPLAVGTRRVVSATEKGRVIRFGAGLADGGAPSPHHYWTSQDLNGERRRVHRARVDGDGTISLALTSDELTSGESQLADRWCRFSTLAVGRRFAVRIEPGSCCEVRGLDLEGHKLGPQRNK